jgi:hypothetical protein
MTGQRTVRGNSSYRTLRDKILVAIQFRLVTRGRLSMNGIRSHSVTPFWRTGSHPRLLMRHSGAHMAILLNG